MSRSRELWFEQREFLRRSGFSLRTLQRMVREKQIRIRRAGTRSRNGRDIVQYAASSLPPSAQKFLMQERIARSHIPETQMSVRPHPQTHADRQISMFISPPAIPEDVRIALSSEQNEVAQQRLEVISPMLEFLKKSNGYKPTVHLQDGRDLLTLGAIVEYICEQRKISERTVWRWYSRFKQHGFPALADDIRADKGTSRIFQQAPSAAQFAQAKYLGERLSVRRVYQILLGEWPKLTPGAQIKAPSYEVLRRFLNALPSPVTIMAREGERQHHERCAPYLLTDFKSVRANQIWISDHCKHDVWVRNDFFSGLPQNAALRPWITAIVDMRTRKCMGAVWCANPSSHSISSALRIAIKAWGIPDTFYIDNGKDYASIGRIDMSPEASGVLAQLGIEPQYCIPKHPQSKLIERWFGTMHERFDKLWHPFYCGSSSATRGENCDLALKEHSKLLKEGRAHSSPLPSASEFVAMCKDWIQEYNAHHLHSGRDMSGKTPNELFEELLPPEKRRMIEGSTSPQALNALFWKIERRRVSEGGCVTIDGHRYEPADPDSGGRLYIEIEKDILIARDPNDLGEALALDLDRRLIGRLQCQKLIARGPVSRDDVRAGMRKQREARRAVKSYIEFIAGSHETELDKLRSSSARMPAKRGLPAPPEVMPPMRKVVGLPERLFVGDMVREFMEKD